MRIGVLLGLWLFTTLQAWGQATSSAALSGTVTDPAGATVPEAKVTLFSSDTGYMRPFVTSDSGQFVFPLLQPGRYRLRVERGGFKLYVRSDIVLGAGQVSRLNPVLEISSDPQYVLVESTSRVLSASSRLHSSLRADSLQDMPMQGRNFLSLIGAAPGVTGRGATADFDNFAPEKEFDLSANGRNSTGNLFLLDGLNVTSNIVLGVANLSPNPDSIEEFTVQTNTFSVEQGRASSLQIHMVSKGGTNDFHGTGSYFFTSDRLRARTVFTDRYEPFRKNNVAATLGGPLQKNKTFFFSSVDMLRSKESQATSVQTFESPEFVAFARKNYPDSLGTRVLTEAPLVNVGILGVARRAGDVAGADCGTPASRMLPCDMPLIVEGQYKPNSSRAGLQYNFRGDRYFRDSRDRVFGNYYRTTLDVDNAPVRLGTGNSSVYGSRALELSWTRSFSSSLLNEFSFSGIKVQGANAPVARFHIPQIDIAGQSTGISPGWGGAYSQHNYNWRELLSWVRGGHSLKFGASYYWSDDAADFTSTMARPAFSFANLMDLVRDAPQSVSGLGYDPLTGQPGRVVFGGKVGTLGVFVQDEWNVASNLTLSLGFRWDDLGQPTGTEGMRFTYPVMGQGSNMDARIAGTGLRADKHPYPHRLNRNFSPRVGAAWSPGGRDVWRVHGGIGLYQDWVSLGQSVDVLRTNPPNNIVPTFRAETAIKPVFTLGTSDTFPFGFQVPQIPVAEFDERGGLVGARPNIGLLTPDLQTPQTLTWMAGVERRLPGRLLAGLNYSGSHTWDALIGTDYNRVAGDLFDGSLDRLNPSFGQMWYVWSGNVIDYHAMIASIRRDLSQGATFQASYTLSRTTDYGQAGSRQNRDGPFAIPYQHEIGRTKAYADWDARHRFSLSGSWRLPDPLPRVRPAKAVLHGWQVSAVAAIQSGNPFTVVNRNSFDPIRDASGKVIGLKPDSGDYNADGFDYDYPDTPARDFTGSHSRQEYLSGIFRKEDFPAPSPGAQGNLKRSAYRNPGLLNLDMGLIKNHPVPIGERGNLQLRFEFFNVLNRVNLQGVNNNLASSTFGRSTSAYSPRVIQLGLRLLF